MLENEVVENEVIKNTISRYSVNELETIKTKIENMGKQSHIEILKILKNNPNVKLNENKSGVFVNLSFLSKDMVDEVIKYIDFISQQENSISYLETQKEDFKNTFFTEKEDKDNYILYNSIVK